jgi:hypothetical protein
MLLNRNVNDVPQDGSGMPGETAPIDGTEFLAAIGYGLDRHICERLAIYRDEASGCWRIAGAGSKLHEEAVIIRWMPMPRV